MSYEDSARERAKWKGEVVVYPLFMTKVWPDFTKAQPRGRLKRAASVTRVAWGDRRRNCRVVKVGRGLVLREARQSAARPLTCGYSLMSFRCPCLLCLRAITSCIIRRD